MFLTHRIKNTWVLRLCLFLSLFVSCGQSKRNINYIHYFPVISEADSLYLSGHFNESYFLLDSLFKKYEIRNTVNEIPLFIKVSHLSKNDNHIRKLYRSLFIHFGYKEAKIRHDTFLYEIFLKQKFTNDELNRFSKKYRGRSIKGLKEQLIKMKQIDQSFRQGAFNNMTYKYQRDSIDEINKRYIIEIFENIGYPGQSKFDYSPQADIHTVLLHTNDSFRLNYILPKIIGFIRKGECDPYIYGTLVDQYHLYNGGKQTYNTYLNDPLRYDTIKTRKLRSQIGLHSSPSINHWIFYQYEKKYLNNRPSLKKVIIKNIFYP